jgi:hypothetical protein
MNESSSIREEQTDWNRIFEVLQPPSRDRIQFLRPGYRIEPGDFGWASPAWPNEKEGMVHLTGYDAKLMNIWYADLKLSEVRYVGPKPTEFPKGKKPYLVRRPTPSVTLYIARLKQYFLVRWHWWKIRDIRKENLLKHGRDRGHGF